jgi:hypothetical protein
MQGDDGPKVAGEEAIAEDGGFVHGSAPAAGGRKGIGSHARRQASSGRDAAGSDS